MERFYDSLLIEAYLNQTKFNILAKKLQKYLFVTKYQKGEFVTTALQQEHLFQHQPGNVYVEANSDVICLAISVGACKNVLLANCQFLQLICESLSQKMETITAFDAAPESLKQRVLTYMKYKCSNGEIKGLQKAALHLNCSARQLQRILTQYESEGVVIKIGKGAYKLTD